jgi:hypothetical protein
MSTDHSQKIAAPVKVEPSGNSEADEDNQLLLVGGIAEYMNSDGKPFTGKIKENAEDFVVNEISAGGDVVTLTEEELKRDKIPSNFHIPPPLESKKAKKALKDMGADEFFLQWSQMELEKIISPESLAELQEFVRNQEANPPAVGTSPDERPSCVVRFLRPEMAESKDDAAEQERQYRRYCHRALQIRWPWMKTSTVTQAGGAAAGAGAKEGAVIRVSHDEFFDAIRPLLSADDLRRLQAFIITSKDAAPPHGGAPPCVWLGRGADKALRTSIHQCIARTMAFLQSTSDMTGEGGGGDGGGEGEGIEGGAADAGGDAAADSATKASSAGKKSGAAGKAQAAWIKVTRKPGKAARWVGKPPVRRPRRGAERVGACRRRGLADARCTSSSL